MTSNHTKTNLQAHDGAHNRKQVSSPLLLSLGALLQTLLGTKSNLKQIATDDNRRYHRLTTKLLAVKPSRHTLAIFMPKICLTTNQQVNKGMNKNTLALRTNHIFSAIGANIYDGLIEPNKIPLVGNKLNRLVTVVKTRRPLFLGGIKLTKLTKLLGTIHHG